MPEIAEVETVRRTLKKQILNKKIKYIKILYPKIIEKESLDINNIIYDTIIIRAKCTIVLFPKKYTVKEKKHD